MNKFTAFAAAGVLATTALFAVQASADDNENSAFAQMVSENTYAAAPAAHEGAHKAYGYGYQAGTLSRVSAKTSDVAVYRLGELNKAEREMYSDRANADPARVAALQEQIKASPAVRNALLAKNVQISSVIGEIKGADGSTAYVLR
ncbi:hypothetical protein [Rhizobium sp. C4]|uniref:hypothetical protein n=1 Tax=Rhizobium sp. C4 TaxID=1349800 RepID=UPI001E47C66B|nr:hypothetical protein [Rhizobium sp. C4]MCD2174615.1 hypothetical protein [Rhizobium sp. C4]